MVLETAVRMTTSLDIDIDKHTRDGSQLLQEGQLEKAKQYFELAFRSSQQYSDGFTERACAFNLGAVYIALNQPERGLEMLQRAIPPMNQRDGKSNGDLYYNFGLGYEMLKNDAEAVKFFELAYEEYKFERENVRMETDTAVKAGGLYSKLSSPLQAARCYGIAAVGFAQLQEFTQQALCLCKQALHLLQCHRLEEAVQIGDDCMILCQRITSPVLLGKLYNDLGLIYSQCHEFPKAATCFEFALPISQGPNGEKKKQAIILQNLGAVYNFLGDYQRALNFHERAAALHAELGDRSSQGQCFINLAFAYSQLGDKDSAGECFLHALQAGKDMNEKQTQWQALEGLGAVAFNSDHVDKAISYFKQALATLAASGGDNNMAQERIVMKLTDALQIQLSKQNLVDPKNVRAPSAQSTTRGSGMAPQAAYQNVQMGVPPVFLNDLPRPPTREEQRQMNEIRSYVLRGRQDRGSREFENIALGVSDYNTDDDLSIPGGNRNPKNRPMSAKPRSRGKGKILRHTSVGHDTPDIAHDKPFPVRRVHATVAEEVSAPPPPAESEELQYDKLNTTKRKSKKASHINGIDEPNEDLKRRSKPSLLRTETHNSEDEWRRRMKEDRHSNSVDSLEYAERLRPSSTEEEESDEQSNGEAEERGKPVLEKNSKRDRILRMMKGDTNKQTGGDSSSDDAIDRPKALGTATTRVKGPGQQESTSSSAEEHRPAENENSQQLVEMYRRRLEKESTGPNDELMEYQRRIRRKSMQEENPDMPVTASETESASESETSGGRQGERVPPPVPFQSPPNTMLGKTYEEPIPYDPQAKKTFYGANYFRPEGHEESKESGSSSPGVGASKLKETQQDPNDPDYMTIRTLKRDEGHWQGQEEDSPEPGPSEGPPLPPRKLEDMSRAEEEEYLRSMHIKRRETEIALPQKRQKDKRSKACVVM